MFCAHLIMIWLAGPLIGKLTGALGSTFYPPFLLLQPLMTLGATLLLGRALMACAPATATLLSGGRLRQRSEEHTSELQSLMRISYAVFCLKKKNQILNRNTM